MYNVHEYDKLNPEWVHGIDISKFQDDEFYIEDLNLAYQAGYRFCLIRATRGNKVDIKLEHNFDLAASAGFIIGFYHYYSNRVEMNGERQGLFHIDTVNPYFEKLGGKMLKSHIDVERDYNNVGAQYKYRNTMDISSWLVTLYQDTPWKGGVYSSKTMWNLMTTNPPWGSEVLGWVADWTEKPDIRYYPLFWKPEHCHYWQWAVAGHPKLNFDPPYVPGIKGTCDVDIYRGTLDELKAEAGHDAPEPEPVKTYPGIMTVNIDGVVYESIIDLVKAK